MAYTQDDIDRLKKAMASGARRVKLGSGDSAEETEFRSLADMERLLAIMTDEITPAKATPAVTYVEHSRE